MNPWAVLAVVSLAAAEGPGVTVVYSDGRPPRALTSMVRDDVVYHRLDEIASSLSAVVTWIPARRRATVVADRDSMALTIDSRFLTLNGRGVALEHPVIYADGAVLVPEAFVEAVPPLLTAVHAVWVDSLGQLQVEGMECDMHLMRVVEDSISLRLEIGLPSYAEWTLSPFAGDSVMLTVQGATVCLPDFEQLASDSAPVTVSARQEPGRAVLVAHRTQSGISARCTSTGASMTWLLGSLPPSAVTMKPLGRIALDAGHGGDDPGARSTDGVPEKDVTLTVATRLAETLRERFDDIEVILIRTSDVSMTPSHRVERANQASADVFVSIHCNWSFDRSQRGLRVSFASPGHTDAGPDVVSRDGFVHAGVTSHDPRATGMEKLLPWDTAPNVWIPASERLSSAITTTAMARGISAQPPMQAPLELLEGLAMPGVVVEVGYLSSPIETRDLATLEYLDLVAAALADGLAQYHATASTGVEP